VELIVVLAMIAIVVGFAAPRIDFIHFEIHGAVQRVNSTVMAAQRTAIKRQHNVIVAFDVEGGLIRIHEDANNNRQGNDYAIEVERATGRVSWLHYGGTKWGRGADEGGRLDEMTTKPGSIS
jgi:hypothetical protein